MIIFKILLIILVALPVIILAYIWFKDIVEYVKTMNARDRRRNSGNRKPENNDFSSDGTGGGS